ncbi:MAG: hypothetical protein ACRC8P_00855 [Spiroplasma sp.]
MNIFLCMNKIFNYPDNKILDMSLSNFYEKINHYQFDYNELVIILGILLNKPVIEQTKEQLNLVAKNFKDEVVITFAVFAYIFIGDEYNDDLAISELKIDLAKTERKLFISTLNTLISNSSRIFNLSSALGNDNDRANMFAVNALLNIKRGLGFDNFHITLFTVYQSLELKLKHCLKKYIDSEPSAQKKQINFHNLVRLIKLISTTRVTDQEMADILKSLREYLRYFEKINPGGQAARYEAAPNTNYFNESDYSIVNEKELLENFVHALSLLQSLYLKLIEIYDNQDSQVIKDNFENSNLNINLAKLIGANLDDDENKINDKLRNLLDHQIFGDYQELINLSYQELNILRFLIRIGFMQSVNQAINQLLKN